MWTLNSQNITNIINKAAIGKRIEDAIIILTDKGRAKKTVFIPCLTASAACSPEESPVPCCSLFLPNPSLLSAAFFALLIGLKLLSLLLKAADGPFFNLSAVESSLLLSFFA